MLKVTLVKSLIGAEPRNRKTAHALGLRKIGQSNTFEDSPAIRGMIHHVKHLLKVEIVEDGEIRRRRVVRGAAESAPAAPEVTEAPKAKRTTKKTKEDKSE